ncbi:hypothetical protein A9G35_03835 [Gilliamella sp. Choc5-1]|uniref:helix-turn-helix domain-containing protein n=1 Tax=Gilliamella sp. Choc5-1 TaxID=3120238 RepID=UPI00080DAE2C|nr:helix-turn-helix domain-containing protein [Gilliamella apicola]OCG47482.1 hypothetical protein A9G35_03835 [Gilliamella apicola]
MASYFWTILHNEAEYQKAMDRFTELFGKELTPLSEESDEFELLAMLIEKYENLNYPVEAPSPIDYIKFIMDQKGLTNEDMKKYLGSSSKVSEVLNGKRNLSLNMIKKLHNGLGIPADILIQDINCIDDENNGVIFSKLINNEACYIELEESTKFDIILICKNIIEKIKNPMKGGLDNNYPNDTNSCLYY